MAVVFVGNASGGRNNLALCGGTWWWCSFSTAMAHILNACIHCIVTCTVWWWWQSFLSRNACGGRYIVACTVWWW